MKPRDELPSIDLDSLGQVEGAGFSISFGCGGGFPFAGGPFMAAFAPAMAMASMFAPDPYAAYYGYGPSVNFGVTLASRPQVVAQGAQHPRPPTGQAGYHGGSRRS